MYIDLYVHVLTFSEDGNLSSCERSCRVCLCLGPQLKAQTGEEQSRALQELRASLEEEHGAALASSRAQWAQEQEAQVLQQLQTQLAQAKAAWQDEHSKVLMAQPGPIHPFQPIIWLYCGEKRVCLHWFNSQCFTAHQGSWAIITMTGNNSPSECVCGLEFPTLILKWIHSAFSWKRMFSC